MSKEKKVKLELSVYQAAAVRQALFSDTKVYTYDSQSVPKRVVEIRNVIVDIDDQLEKREVNSQKDCPPGTVFADGECLDL